MRFLQILDNKYILLHWLLEDSNTAHLLNMYFCYQGSDQHLLSNTHKFFASMLELAV